MVCKIVDIFNWELLVPQFIVSFSFFSLGLHQIKLTTAFVTHSCQVSPLNHMAEDSSLQSVDHLLPISLMEVQGDFT